MAESTEYISSKLFYSSFTGKAVPKFLFWDVVPWAALLLAGYALVTSYKNRSRWWMKSMLIVGLLYWLFYFTTSHRIIIDFERVVVSTSIIIIIFGGIGLQKMFDLISKNDFVIQYEIIKWTKATLFLIIFLLIFSYTYRDKWQNFTLYHPDFNKIFMPAAPANMYLTPDDLRVFENIKSEKFLSHPWKGTVIGVATDNYPVCTKPGTVTMSKNKFSEFMKADCEGKNKIAEKIRYFYVPKIDCENFILIDEGGEGFFLYEYKK